MTTDNLTCPRCGRQDVRLTWQTCWDGRRHLRASCCQCGAFLKYVEQTARNVARAEEPPADPDLFAEVGLAPHGIRAASATCWSWRPWAMTPRRRTSGYGRRSSAYCAASGCAADP
jgi:hypothetical protein